MKKWDKEKDLLQYVRKWYICIPRKTKETVDIKKKGWSEWLKPYTRNEKKIGVVSI